MLLIEELLQIPWEEMVRFVENIVGFNGSLSKLMSLMLTLEPIGMIFQGEGN